MWEIWANKLLPKALNSCPKSKKLPNLVTLIGEPLSSIPGKGRERAKKRQKVCVFISTVSDCHKFYFSILLILPVTLS